MIQKNIFVKTLYLSIVLITVLLLVVFIVNRANGNYLPSGYYINNIDDGFDQSLLCDETNKNCSFYINTESSIKAIKYCHQFLNVNCDPTVIESSVLDWLTKGEYIFVLQMVIVYGCGNSTVRLFTNEKKYWVIKYTTGEKIGPMSELVFDDFMRTHNIEGVNLAVKNYVGVDYNAKDKIKKTECVYDKND